MVTLFVPYIFGMLMPLAVKGEVCGGTSGQPCSASLIYTEFESVYLAASTSNFSLGRCGRLQRLEDNVLHINSKFENGTQAFENTENLTFTNVPDVVNITLGIQPNTVYQVQIPYADSEACFVSKFPNALFGCRLWIQDNATSEQITACMEGHVQACPGTIYDTWNEEACT